MAAAAHCLPQIGFALKQPEKFEQSSAQPACEMGLGTTRPCAHTDAAVAQTDAPDVIAMSRLWAHALAVTQEQGVHLITYSVPSNQPRWLE
jgi:hypothetical protein